MHLSQGQKAQLLDPFGKGFNGEDIEALYISSVDDSKAHTEFTCGVFHSETYDEKQQWWLSVRAISRFDNDILVIFTYPKENTDEDASEDHIAYVIDLPENDYLKNINESANSLTALHYYRTYGIEHSSTDIPFAESQGSLELPKQVIDSIRALLEASNNCVQWNTEEETYCYTKSADNLISQMQTNEESRLTTDEFDYDFLESVLPFVGFLERYL